MSTPDHCVKFIPGQQLAKSLFLEAVQPIMSEAFPDLRYAAGLMGSRSEVLGFDDVMSSDRHWEPWLMLFLKDPDLGQAAAGTRATLAERLPASLHGYSTHWSLPDTDDGGNQFLEAYSEGAINHRVEV